MHIQKIKQKKMGVPVQHNTNGKANALSEIVNTNSEFGTQQVPRTIPCRSLYKEEKELRVLHNKSC